MTILFLGEFHTCKHVVVEMILVNLHSVLIHAGYTVVFLNATLGPTLGPILLDSLLKFRKLCT